MGVGILFVVTLLTYPPETVFANNGPTILPDEEEPAHTWTVRELQLLSDYYADMYGISRSLLRAVIKCESEWVPDVQSRHIYDFNDPRLGIYVGQRERSFGLAQISEPHHPTVTYEQMIDPYFALDFAAKHIAAGRGYWWTCYNIINEKK